MSHRRTHGCLPASLFSSGKDVSEDSISASQASCPRAGIPTSQPRVYNIQSRSVTRYPANSIVVVGGCPVCRVGVLEDSFTFLGIFLAIILFPFGFICCFALRKRRCPNCGASFN
ncbi:membrane protein BRI3 isoform X2 [Sorex fumeus]|uniref:membrane protein BRI3 isoform X2 n=1 Tax=Sorex fumeus TaxID=62283 RepID=UPI0024ADF246|nr:membrane protein BRI3 isoform X2 [Sorex fumeus]